MNLWLRLVWALLRARRLPRIAPGATIERRLRVWPGDVDINGHMNNGRYLTIIDLMLGEYFVRSGFARVMVRSGWRPMSGGAVITYRKGRRALRSGATGWCRTPRATRARGHAFEATPLPAAVEHWLAAERAVMNEG